MAVRYTVIETEIYTAIQKFKQKHKKQSHKSQVRRHGKLITNQANSAFHPSWVGK